MAISTQRDRSILKLMRDALAATNQFDQVLTTGDPEQAGASADAARFASFEIHTFKEVDDYDDDGATPQIRTVHFTLYVITRNEDPDTRDDECDRLVQVASNAISGQSFGGATFPNLTRLGTGKYKPVTGSERRCEVAGVFAYLIDNYDAHNTDPL